MRFLLALALFAAPAAAQTVVFHTGFENGLEGWTRTGMWNAQTSTSSCGALVAPFPEGTGVAWYGDPASCNYDDGTDNQGTLTLNAWIDLPAAATSISLRYWSLSQTEYCWQAWDIHRVFVEVEGGSPFFIPYCESPVPAFTDLPWHERRGDLTSLAGRRIRPRFEFRTNDGAANQFLGWFLDDLSVEVEPGVRVCPGAGFATGCPCHSTQAQIPVAGGCLNSTSRSAALRSGGMPSVAGDTLTLRAESMPPNTWCILSQSGASMPSVVFGDGIRCAGGPIQRMGQQQASSGIAIWPLPSESLSVRGFVPAGGGTRWYHVHYRDVADFCTSATFNVTDTQRIVWVP